MGARRCGVPAAVLILALGLLAAAQFGAKGERPAPPAPAPAGAPARGVPPTSAAASAAPPWLSARLPPAGSCSHAASGAVVVHTSAEAAAAARSCAVARVEVPLPVGLRERVAAQVVPLPAQNLWHCLYYPCTHDKTEDGWYDCLQKTDLRRPAHAPESTGACVDAARPAAPSRLLADIDTWTPPLASQRKDNPNPMRRELRLPPDTTAAYAEQVVIGQTGAVVTLGPDRERVAPGGVPYHGKTLGEPSWAEVAASREAWLACLARPGEADCGELPVRDRVVVISQPLGAATFHFLVEGMPRVGPFLKDLAAERSVSVHCYASSPLVRGFLSVLGLSPDRLVGGRRVLARRVWVPSGGRAHDPFQALWGMHALHRHLRPAAPFFAAPPGERPSCRAHTPQPLAVLLLQRTRNRFVDYREEISQAIAVRIRRDFGDGRQARVVLYSDRDKLSVRQQLALWHEADAAVGMHGAGFSLMMFARHGCMSIICYRTGAASDIYEHMALAFGHRFHHVLWRRSVPWLLDDIAHELRNIHTHWTAPESGVAPAPLPDALVPPPKGTFVEVAPTTPAPGVSAALLRIALIAVFVGTRPPPAVFFDAWETVRGNAAILDLLVIAEQGPAQEALRQELAARKVPNVRIVTEYGGLAGFIHRRTSELVPGLPVLTHALGWNLCDYRPLFGSIFEDQLKQYSHWGWADTHLYLGDLMRHTRGGADFHESDVVTFKEVGSWSLFTSGTITVFRNTPAVREAWRALPAAELRRTLEDPQNNQNDEYLVSNAVLTGSSFTVAVHFQLHRDWRNAALVAPPAEGAPWRVVIATPRHDLRRVTAFFNASVCCREPTPVPQEEVKVRWRQGVLAEHHRGFFTWRKDPRGQWWRHAADPSFFHLNPLGLVERYEAAALHAREAPCRLRAPEVDKMELRQFSSLFSADYHQSTTPSPGRLRPYRYNDPKCVTAVEAVNIPPDGMAPPAPYAPATALQPAAKHKGRARQ
eukprot:TRINITY_DN14597_c0_g1_i1.p1 TRINITY_DN14597_c0_g1~~TRINITY_DN14597_c0_g1_i1.p1  ORF type:complete len:1014 (+),score=262.97 TRINITY_DN14597_c0_g1_i1:81-3044(+)